MIALLVSFIGGALMPFAFLPADQSWLVFPLLSGLFFLWQKFPQHAFRLGWAWGFGQFLTGTYWVFISAHTYSGAPLYFAVFITLLLAAYLGIYHGVIGWLWCRYSDRQSWRAACLLFVLFLCGEFLRKWVFAGFPWLSLGYSQVETPLAAFAPLIGVYGLSFMVLLLSWLLLKLCRRQNLIASCAGMGAVALLAFAASFGHWTTETGQVLSVAVVQANISQDEKWSEEGRTKAIHLHKDLTRAVQGTDLVIWPEVALPGAYSRFTAVFVPLDRWLKANQMTLMSGVMHHVDETNQFANSMTVMGHQQDLSNPVFYNKRHLVPFGEFFPVPNFVKAYLQAVKLPYTDLHRGKAEQPMLTVQGVEVGTSICFEDGFANEMRPTIGRAGFLVNVSNDAWFGRSVAAGQHLQVTQMRALEFGRYVARGTPTGIGAIIDHKGRVVDRTDRFVPQVLLGEVAVRTGLTPYAKMGEWPVAILMLILLLLGLLPRKNMFATKASG